MTSALVRTVSSLDVAGVVSVGVALTDRAVTVLDDVLELSLPSEFAASLHRSVLGLEEALGRSFALDLVGPLAVYVDGLDVALGMTRSFRWEQMTTK